MRLPILLLLLIVLAACRKEMHDDNTNSTIGSMAKSPYPDTVHYIGSLRATNSLDDNCQPHTGFDTTYPTILAVYYPDSFHVNFQLVFWDCMTSNYPLCNFQRYIFRQENNYVKNSAGSYMETSRHYHTRYTLQGDSLIIEREEGLAIVNYYHYLIFGGKKL